MAAYQPAPFALFESKIVPVENANISIMTNGLHYGGGIFGGIKAYPGPRGIEMFRLDDHLERMRQSCRILRFPYNFQIDEIRSSIIRLAKRNKLTGTTYIRPLVYRADTELSPSIAGRYDLAVYMLSMKEYFNSEKGLSVAVSSWRRNSDNALPPRTKATGGYLNSALAIHDAQQGGYDSAIFLDEQGNVSEGAVMNLFIVKGGTLVTPTLDSSVLEGITRRTVIDLAVELGITVMERTINRSELYTADEIFFSGTAVEIAWCREVDGVSITAQPGHITSQLRSAYNNLPETHPHLFTAIK
jgi:branched-chain amino acid aminotransferase